MPGQKAPEETRREQILNAAYAVALRTGVDGVTVRAVAAEAGLSHGLVLFHFGRKDQLVAALLDRVLSTTAMLRLSDDLARGADGLHALLQRQLQPLLGDPSATRLFFEYWALGAREPAIRAKIGAALERYREAVRALAEDALRADPAPRAGITPDGLAAVAVSLVSGGAVQALAAPGAFDMAAYLATVKGMVEQVVAPVPAPDA
jgi:AcrR family transcriptional regulator